MPRYKWIGINLYGKKESGRQFAASQKALAAILLEHDIGYLESRLCRNELIHRPINMHDKQLFFANLAALLKAGFVLSQALALVQSQTSSLRLQAVVYEIKNAIAQGKSFADALSMHTHIFTQTTIRLLKIAQESETLTQTVGDIAHYLEETSLLKKKVRNALLLPACTFGFFLILFLLIFLGIIPRLEPLFHATGRQCAPLTQMVIQFSHWVHDYFFITMGIATCMVFGFFFLCRQSQRFARSFSRMLTTIPGVKNIQYTYTAKSITHLLHLLLRAHVPLHKAIVLLQQAVMSQPFTHTVVKDIKMYIEQGNSLSRACSLSNKQVFDNATIAMLAIAEASGTLPSMLKYIYRNLEKKTMQRLQAISCIIGPVCMLAIGALLTLLIISVYGPLLHFADTITSL